MKDLGLLAFVHPPRNGSTAGLHQLMLKRVERGPGCARGRNLMVWIPPPNHRRY